MFNSTAHIKRHTLKRHTLKKHTLKKHILKKHILIVCAIATILFMPIMAHAVNPNEMLSNPELESRARQVSKSIRCVVCRNQSIDDSNASLAKELRLIVRERIEIGDTNEQVLQYLTLRYGDYVLLEPPVSLQTIFLWGIPMVILILGLGIALTFLRRNQTGVEPLNPAEIKAVQEILKQNKKDTK